MNERFKFRYVNEIVGAFVLGTIALVIAGIVVVGRTQRWFMPVQRLTITLPEAGSLGLRDGAEVLILGTVVGSVDDIEVDASGRMQAVVNIRRDYARFVSEDSTAIIRKTLGVAGDAFVEISRGTGPSLPPGGAIPATADKAPTDLLADLLQQVRVEILPAVKQVRTAIDAYTAVAADLHDPHGRFQDALGHVDRIATSVEQGQGLAGKLLSDRQMARQVEELLPKANASADQVQLVLKDLQKSAASLAQITDSGSKQMKELPALVEQTRQTLEQVQLILKDVQKTTAHLPSTVGAVDQTVQSLPGLITQTQETLRQLQRLIEGAQRSWLIGGAVPSEARPGRIRPEDVGGGQ